MSGWTSDELTRVGAADELEIDPIGADGTPHRPVRIWVVRVGDELYVRSWRGAGGSWWRNAKVRGAGRISASGVDKGVAFEKVDAQVSDAVDAGYREKYGRHPTYVEPMVSPQARATTLRLIARNGPEAQRLVHRHRAHRHHRSAITALTCRRRARALDPGRAHRLAHPPPRPNDLRHRGIGCCQREGALVEQDPSPLAGPGGWSCPCWWSFRRCCLASAQLGACAFFSPVFALSCGRSTSGSQPTDQSTGSSASYPKPVVSAL